MKKRLLEHTRISKKERRYPKNKVILLIVSIILLTIIITGFIYSMTSVFDVQEYNYYITVSRKGEIGLNIDTDALYFGKIPLGSSGSRYVNIVNTYTKPLKVIIKFLGDSSEWVTTDDNYFIMGPNQTKKITVTASIPGDAQLGEYTGAMHAIFKKT